MKSVLENCLVLDLSRLLPGPYCSMILADHGARVIAIEDRRFEAEFTPVLSNLLRNKAHMTLNLKKKKGKEIFFSLAKKADVILEGFRPGTMDRMGVGYEDIRKINPAIIYCSITGYGQTGPLRDRPGHDVNYLSYSGALSLMGPKEGAPCIPGIQVADIVGGLNGAIGILLALHARGKTGRGQHIDISMTDGLLSMLPVVAGWYWTFGEPPLKGDAFLSHRYACYTVYRTSDGKFVALGALEPHFWKEVCLYFNVPEFIPLQFDDSKKDEVIAFFQQAFLKKTRDQWMKIFSRKNACLSGVLEVGEALAGELAKSRNMVVKMEAPGKSPACFLGLPVKLSDTPGSIRTLPPKFGENTRQVLEELGLSQGRIRQLAAEGVI